MNWWAASLYLVAFVVAIGGPLLAPDRETALLLFCAAAGIALLVVVGSTNWRDEMRETRTVVRQVGPWIAIAVSFVWFGFDVTLGLGTILFMLWVAHRIASSTSTSTSNPEEPGGIRADVLDDMDGDG